MDGSKSKDPDGDPLTYSWMQTYGPPVKLDMQILKYHHLPTPSNLPSDTTFKFLLTVKDEHGATSSPSTVSVIVTHTNSKPVANAGTDQIVNAGDTVSLDGSASKDPEGDPLRYSWKQTGDPPVRLNDADTSTPTFNAPSNISADTNLIFKLTVTDSKNATSSDIVKITDKPIMPPNKPPVANAGTDQIVNAGDTVSFDGSASKDPDGNIVSYSWVQTAGPKVIFNNNNNNRSIATFTAPSVSADTELKFSLKVKDNKGAESVPAVMSVIVKAPSSIVKAPSSLSNNVIPSNAGALNNQGIALISTGQYTEAITYLDKALAYIS